MGPDHDWPGRSLAMTRLLMPMRRKPTICLWSRAARSMLVTLRSAGFAVLFVIERSQVPVVRSGVSLTEYREASAWEGLEPQPKS